MIWFTGCLVLPPPHLHPFPSPHLPDSTTPLHMASKHGWLEVAKLLVEKGAVVNAKNKDGRTPLHVALKYSWTEVEAVEAALRWVT